MSGPNERMSPIANDPPLNLPGESLRRERETLVDEQLLPWFVITLLAVIVAVFEWIRWALRIDPSPWLMTFVALGFVAYFFLRIWPARLAQVRRLTRGEEGERFVAEKLRWLAKDGYRIFDDLEFDGFNIDHVLIGPAGVFVVETKVRCAEASKPKCRVAVVSGRVLVNGRHPERDPVSQVRRNAKDIRLLLERACDYRGPVRAIIAFPGIWVEEGEGIPDVMVVNAKQIRDRVRPLPKQLEEPQIRKLEDCLLKTLQSAIKSRK